MFLIKPGGGVMRMIILLYIFFTCFCNVIAKTEKYDSEEMMQIYNKAQMDVNNAAQGFYHLSSDDPPIVTIYKGLFCLENNKEFSPHMFVEALFSANKNGIKSITLRKIDDNSYFGYTIYPGLLEEFTFQYGSANISEIINWYRKEGYTQSRTDWGIKKIPKILNGNLSQIMKKFYIAEITKYYPVRLMTIPELKIWLKKTESSVKKNKLFKFWANSALKWGIEHIDDPDIGRYTCSLYSIAKLMNRRYLVTLGVIKKRYDLVTINALRRHKGELITWLLSNYSTMNCRNNVWAISP